MTLVQSNKRKNVALAVAVIAFLASTTALIFVIFKPENEGGGGGTGGGSVEPIPPTPECFPAPETCKGFQRGLNVGCDPPVPLDTVRPLTEDMILQIKALFGDRVPYSSESNFQVAAKPGDAGQVGFDFLISTEYDSPAWKASQIAEYCLQGITANDQSLEDTAITVSSTVDSSLVSNPKEKTIVTFYKLATPLPGNPGRTTEMPLNDRNTGIAYVRGLHPEDKCYICS